ALPLAAFRQAHSKKMRPLSQGSSDRKALRAEMRARRRAVPPAERLRCAQLVAHHVDRELRLRAGRRIALYAALPEELDTLPLLRLARRRGCRIHLPRIDDFESGRMSFVEIDERDDLEAILRARR